MEIQQEQSNLDKTNNIIIEKNKENFEQNEKVKEEKALEIEQTEEKTEKIVEENPKTEKTVDNKVKEADDDVPDVVKEATELNKKLKEELEDLKTRNSNVFEENEALKKQLEEQKELDELGRANAEMKAELEAIKRNTIIGGLMASGKINDSLKAWAENLSFEQLEEFAKHAPKIKTVLDEKNASGLPQDEDFEKWQAEQSKSRIIG